MVRDSRATSLAMWKRNSSNEFNAVNLLTHTSIKFLVLIIPLSRPLTTSEDIIYDVNLHHF